MARVIFLTDFSEAYARELLLGMARYAHDTAQAWSLCRLPLSIRDKFGIEAVVEWAVRMKADAVIGQFYNTDNVGLFRENGIIAIAQDFKKRFTTIDLIGRRRPQFTHVDLLLGDRVHQVDDHLPRPLARKGIAVHARTGRRRKLHPDIFTG